MEADQDHDRRLDPKSLNVRERSARRLTPIRTGLVGLWGVLSVAAAGVAAGAPSGGFLGDLWTAFWCAPLVIQLFSLIVLGSVALLWFDAFGDFRRGGKRTGKSDEQENQLGQKDMRSAVYSFAFGIIIGVVAVAFAGIIAPDCFVSGLQSQLGGVIPGLGTNSTGTIVAWDLTHFVVE